jgi:hypothetical protein
MRTGDSFFQGYGQCRRVSSVGFVPLNVHRAGDYGPEVLIWEVGSWNGACVGFRVDDGQTGDWGRLGDDSGTIVLRIRVLAVLM